MYKPFILIPNLSAEQIAYWHKFYTVSPSGFDRKVEEGLWRRTQEEKTRSQSGWQSPADARRRMLHYKHHFGLIQDGNQTHLAMTAMYIWMHYTFPKDEINTYYNQIKSGLQHTQWSLHSNSEKQEVYQKDGLQLKIDFLEGREEDRKRNRTFPSNYQMMELTFTTDGYQPEPDLQKHPWYVLDSGIRTKDTRGEATIITDESLDTLIDLFPAQVELGCGSSIEAGVPPLGFLHKVYYVSNRDTHQFILDPQTDQLASRLITNTQESLNSFTEMFTACFTAKITPFYEILKKLHDHGYIVGDIITNNFDGIPTRLGLTEINVRRYDEVHIVPHIDFDPKAKSLLVIGSHADRRKVEASARQQGIKVIYIDPEGFYTDDGFKNYPLESPQNGDFLYRQTAAEAFQKIEKRLIERNML